MSHSLAEQVALLPPEERSSVLEGFDPDALLYDSKFWLRPEQMEPESDYAIWGIVSGRGFGKTRAGSEWIREKAKKPDTRFFLVGRTAADVRDTMIGGESGILAVHPPSERPEWKPTKRELKWPNGSTALTFSSAEPNQLRGPQAEYAWCDELAAWWFVPDDVGLHAWSNVQLATRLGRSPKILFTTTPKLVPELIPLLKGEIQRTVITRGSTYDNAANLSPQYIDFVTGLYGSSRLGRQELEGLLLDRNEGALWTLELIERPRLYTRPSVPLRVVAVDPSVAEKPKDECGIVVAGSTTDRDLHRRHAYILEDATVHGPPAEWAQAVVDTARRWQAPVVAEGNQGLELVKLAIQNIDPTIPVFMVHARANKFTRAEAVVGAYDQGRVHHVGRFAELEEQLISWVPADRKSPDRLDALVWALTALLVKPPPGFGSGPIRATSPARARIPSARSNRGARVFNPQARRSSFGA